MTADTPMTPGAAGASRRLDALDAQLDRAVRSARTRNVITLVLVLISLVMIAYFLWKAHREFTSFDADTAAAFGQSRVVEAMPGAAEDLKTSLRGQAPAVILAGEQRLRELPDRFATVIQTQLDRQLKERTPQAEEHLYQALKASLAEADAKMTEASGGGKTDEERFRVMLDLLVAHYGTETTKLLDELHARYKNSATDIITHLNVLAEGKDLDPQQEAQRTMIRNFLILARQHQGGGNAGGTATVPVAAPAPAAAPVAPAAQPATDAPAPAAQPQPAAAPPAPADAPAAQPAPTPAPPAKPDAPAAEPAPASETPAKPDAPAAQPAATPEPAAGAAGAGQPEQPATPKQ